MKLLIRRDPKLGTLGKQKYALSIRAQLSEAETAQIHVNKLEGEKLLSFESAADKSGSAGAMMRVIRDADLTVGKLIEGVTLICDSLSQLLGVETQATEAAQNLQRYLAIAATFGGETIISLEEAVRPKNGQR